MIKFCGPNYETILSEILVNGPDPGIPYIIGSTSYEGSIFQSTHKFSKKSLISEFSTKNHLFPGQINSTKLAEIATQYLTEFRSDFFDRKKIEELSSSKLGLLAGHLYGDRIYSLPAITTAQLYAKKGTKVW